MDDRKRSPGGRQKTIVVELRDFHHQTICAIEFKASVHDCDSIFDVLDPRILPKMKALGWKEYCVWCQWIVIRRGSTFSSVRSACEDPTTVIFQCEDHDCNRCNIRLERNDIHTIKL